MIMIFDCIKVLCIFLLQSLAFLLSLTNTDSLYTCFSEKDYEGEYVSEVEKRNKMRTVFVTGRDGLTPQQAAILLVQEARMLVQVCNLHILKVIIA